MEIYKGYITSSKNFKLLKKVESLDEFWNAINSEKSLFGRHKMYASSFFLAWSLKTSKTWIDNGWIWICEINEK